MNVILKCGNAKHHLEVAACIIELVKRGSLTHEPDHTVLKISGDDIVVTIFIADINNGIDMSQVGKSIVIKDDNFYAPKLRAKEILRRVGISFEE